MTQRLKINLTDEMGEALDKLSGDLGKPKAQIIREAIASHLKKHKIKVKDTNLSWGGNRRSLED